LDVKCPHDAVSLLTNGKYFCRDCNLTSDTFIGPTSKSVDGFKKFDDGKLQWDMMPEAALEQVIKVFMLGQKKYGRWNWLDNAAEVSYTRYLNAMERHFKKFKRGQDFDEESGLPELAHLICNALMLLTYQLLKLGIDDRRKDLKGKVD
jgi:Domain of unknown function (DUF5664)